MFYPAAKAAIFACLAGAVCLPCVRFGQAIADQEIGVPRRRACAFEKVLPVSRKAVHARFWHLTCRKITEFPPRVIARFLPRGERDWVDRRRGLFYDAARKVLCD
jgi:hypothetical protein